MEEAHRAVEDQRLTDREFPGEFRSQHSHSPFLEDEAGEGRPEQCEETGHCVRSDLRRIGRAAPLPEADLELIVGELRVRVPVGFDEGTLRSMLAVLEVKR